MSDFSNLVLPMSYSVQNAIDNLEMNSTIHDSAGWKSSLDNSENTIVIQVNLDVPHSFNRISFDLLDVPQKFEVFYKDINRNQFVKIRTYQGFAGGVVAGSRSGLDGQESWKSFSFAFPFVNSNLIEIRINRINSALPSFNLAKNTRYAIGIRNTQIRFHRVGGEISSMNEDDEYKVKYFSPNSVLEENDAFWKSPPLGPNSLFPFYVDLRTERGKAQVVEFMKLIPLYTDSHLNVYYSNDDSTSSFSLSNNQKTFSLTGNTSELNNYWTLDRGIKIQSSEESNPKYWEIFNQDIKLDLRSSFTIGFTYEPTDLTNTNVNHKFWSFSAFSEDELNDKILSLHFDPQQISSDPQYIEGDLVVQYENPGSTAQSVSFGNIKFYKDISYGIVLSYNSQIYQWTIAVCAMNTDSTYLDYATLQFDGFYPQKLTINDNPNEALVDQGYLRNLWIRQDVFQLNYVNSFFRNTDTFIRGLGSLNTINNGYYNAVLVAPLTDNLDAKVGPNPAYYSGKVWIPANRNFVLNSSIYNLGRIKAKYLKLEFAKPTVRYYNPATSEQVILPVLDFPDWVKEWFTIHQFDTTIEGTLPNQLFFEGTRIPKNSSNTYGLNSFKSSIESSNNNLIFNHDQIGYDFFLSQTTDEEYLRNQITRNAITLQFPTSSRHNYKIYDYPMTTKRAFFYGIVELSFFQEDQSLQKDNRVYYGDFKEDVIANNNWVENSVGFFETEELAMAASAGNSITSKTLESFSNFSKLQIAYLDSPMKDIIPSDKINFIDTSHLIPKGNASIAVVNNLRGTTDGKTILLSRTNNGIYGLETSEFLVNNNTSTKFVAGCRVRSGSKNPTSYYELRLLSKNTENVQNNSQININTSLDPITVNMSIDMSSKINININQKNNWKIVARKQLKLPNNFEWTEVDLIYNSNDDDTEFKLEIVNLDSFSNETIYVDMLGLWMERNHWEVSNDGGATWVSVLHNANDMFGMISFPESNNRLKLRITSKEPSSWVSQWSIIPIYDSVPVGMSTPRLFETSNADDPEYQDIVNQKLFLSYSTQIPRNYSIINDVVNIKNRI